MEWSSGGRPLLIEAVEMVRPTSRSLATLEYRRRLATMNVREIEVDEKSLTEDICPENLRKRANHH